MPARMTRRTMFRGGFAIGSAFVAGAGDAVPGQSAPGSRWFSSLVWAVLENHGYRQVVDLPSHRRLAQEGTLLTQYFAVAHPSGPNYRAMISGETWGDREVVHIFHPSVPTEAAKVGIPSYVYHLKGTIASRHNPLLDLHAPVAADKHGIATLTADLTRSGPSSVLLYCGWDDENNAHDGPLGTADRNVSALMDALTASRWFNTPDASGRYPAFYLCYDEDDDGESNHVFAAWWGRGVRAGTPAAVRHTHYGFSRTMAENWYLPVLGQAASEAAITEPFGA